MLQIGKIYKFHGQFNKGYTVTGKLIHINLPLRLLTFEVIGSNACNDLLNKKKEMIVSLDHVGAIYPQD